MLPVLAYLGFKALSPNDAKAYAARIDAVWASFYDYDVKPFKKAVDSGAVVKQQDALFDTEQDPVEIGDVLGTPGQMEKLKPYVELRNRLVKDRAAFVDYKENKLSSLFEGPTTEAAMEDLRRYEQSLRDNRRALGSVRKLLTPEPGNLENPGLPRGGDVVKYAGYTAGGGLLVYGIYRLIKRSTEKSVESWR